MALSNKIRLIIVAPILGLAGLGLGFAGFNEYSDSSTLKAQGVEVKGEIIDGKVTTGRKGSKTYYVTVRYEAKPGALPSQKEFKVSQALFDRASNNRGVDVRVLPSDPKVAEIVGEESNGFILMGIGVLCTVGSIFMFTQLFKRDKPPAAVQLG